MHVCGASMALNNNKTSASVKSLNARFKKSTHWIIRMLCACTHTHTHTHRFTQMPVHMLLSVASAYCSTTKTSYTVTH